jgi:hypothetical protein
MVNEWSEPLTAHEKNTLMAFNSRALPEAGYLRVVAQGVNRLSQLDPGSPENPTNPNGVQSSK